MFDLELTLNCKLYLIDSFSSRIHIGEVKKSMISADMA